jgi:hypothetical protein
MLASGAALLTALALLQADAQFAAGARFESRAGEAPSFTSATASQFQVIVSAIPTLRVRMLDEVSDLTASSATRIFWRPQPLFDRRPLFLESLDISELLRPSKRSSWQLNVRASYGEEDYTVLAQQLPTQPSLPGQLTLFSVNGSATGSWKTSRRGAIFFQLNATYRRPTDSQATTGNSGAFLFPTETIASAAPGARFQLTRRTLVEILAAVADTDMSGIPLQNPANGQTQYTGFTTPPNGRGGTGHLNILTVQPQVSITEALTRYHRLRVMAGLTYARALRKTSKDEADLKPVYPLFQLDLDSLLDRTRGGAVWRSTLSTGTLWYADPILGVAVWRGFLQGSITSEVGRNWAAGARVAFGTDLTRLPPSAITAVGGFIPDQTVFSLDLPVRYRASNRLLAEFGASFTERGPYLDSNFGWRRNSREMWLFLNLNAVTTAARTPPRS